MRQHHRLSSLHSSPSPLSTSLNFFFKTKIMDDNGDLNSAYEDGEEDNNSVLQFYLSNSRNKRYKKSVVQEDDTEPAPAVKADNPDMSFSSDFVHYNEPAATEEHTNDAATRRIKDVISNASKNVTIQKAGNDKVTIYKPKLTRPILSLYEYVGVHTALAKFIDAQTSISQFVDDVEINGLVNPAELAFNLLREHKWDAVINRGYERVTYSQLRYNKQWEDMIARYFDEQHATYIRELYEPLKLINKVKGGQTSKPSQKHHNA